MDVPPRIRTAPSASAAYQAYLQTAQWRRRRDEKLKASGYQCQRCYSRRELQVHHLTYERVGAELDADLEVLCRGCHLGEHVTEAQDNVRLYSRIVSSLLAAGQYDSIADLSEAAKRECVRLKVRCNEGQLIAAISVVAPRFHAQVPKQTAELLQRAPEGEDPAKAEAAGLLQMIYKRCGVKNILKVMPSAKPSPIDIYGPVSGEDFGDHDRY